MPSTMDTLDTLVESIITCPICLKHFDQPRLLSPCRDTFCSKCIQQMAVDNNGVMRCLKPDGGRVEMNGINNLDVNNDIIELMNVFESSNNAAPVCDRCVERPAEYWCDSDCKRSFCSVCWNEIHNRGQYLNHTKKPASERPEVIPQCGRHAQVDRSLRFWCETCSEEICADCQGTNHQGHRSISIADYTESFQTETVNSLQAVQSCLTYRRNRADQYADEVNQEYEANKKKVVETMSHLLRAIEEKKREDQRKLEEHHVKLNEEQQNLIEKVLDFVEVRNERNLRSLLDMRQPINEYIERTNENLIALKPLNRKKKHLPGLDTIPPDLGINITLTDTPKQEKEQVKQRITAAAGKKELDLSNMALNCVDMELVANELEINRGLEKLQLFKNEISDMGAQYLADGLRNNTTLTELALYDNQIDSNGLEHLADALRTNRKLKKLTMYRNKIDDDVADMIADTIKNNKDIEPQIRKINVIPVAPVPIVVPAPPIPVLPPPTPNPQLEALIAQNLRATSLNLGGGRYNDNDMGIIAEKLLKNNTKLQILQLHYNQIGDAGAGYLAEALKTNQTLATLYLSTNQIGDVGAQKLAEALRTNIILKELYLGANKIGDNGAQHLADALRQNQTLTLLNLAVNQIGDAGAQHLAQAIKDNQTLTYLGLSANQLGDNGAQALADALRNNQTLTTLWLPNRVSQNVRTQLTQASNGRVSLNYNG